MTKSASQLSRDLLNYLQVAPGLANVHARRIGDRTELVVLYASGVHLPRRPVEFEGLPVVYEQRTPGRPLPMAPG
jgi:hypothetical protein